MTVEELRSLIALRELEPERLASLLGELSLGHVRGGVRLTPGADIYRTRTYDRVDERPEEIAEISYLPAPLVTRAGRANVVGSAMFYASAGLPTTLIESRAQAGQLVVCGRWRLAESMVLQTVGLDLVEHELELLYRDLFRTPGESSYDYSASVAGYLMSGAEIDGLLYPSIIDSSRSHNVALKPASVDRGLTLLYASALLVTDVTPPATYEVQEVDFALPSGARLEWKGRKRQWLLRTQGERLVFEANGWDWNAFTPGGDWVLPE